LNPLCPNCQTELTDDFGLVDCKSCGAVCSIDLEDNVTVQGDEPELVAEESAIDAAEPFESVVEEETEEETFEVESEEAEEPVLESAGCEAVEEEVEDALGLEADAYDDSSAVPAAVAASLSGEDFLKDLEVFSEEAATDGGHIYYDFHVKGLEDTGLKEDFIETLADSRLEISEEAVRDILGDSNKFTLPQISFLRLTVIHKRLLSLGLDMSWSLSEVQEPVSYMMGELADEDVYNDSDGDVVYETLEDDF